MLLAAISLRLLFNSKSTNGRDGLFRWMASIAVDQSGKHSHQLFNLQRHAMFPCIRYAGRLVSYPSNNLRAGGSHNVTGWWRQTKRTSSGTLGRLQLDCLIDPSDSMRRFGHASEY